MALSIVDKRLPGRAKDELSRYFELIEFSTKDITYNSISGHPDIFFCKYNDSLIMAPNLPDRYKEIISKRNVSFIMGSNPVQDKYPFSAIYNAAVTEKYLIHRMDITDSVILETVCGLEKIPVKQGYTRCSLLPLRNNNFITSDHGIFGILKSIGFDALYVKSDEILLPGFSHGFFGGTCGIFDDTVFMAGSLDLFKGGQLIREYLISRKYDIVELYNGPLFDGGSILIFE